MLRGHFFEFLSTDHLKAVPIYMQAIKDENKKQSPREEKIAEIQQRIAECYEKHECWKESVEHFEKVIDFIKRNQLSTFTAVEVYRKAAWCCRLSNDYLKAITYDEEAKKILNSFDETPNVKRKLLEIDHKIGGHYIAYGRQSK